MKKKEEDLLTPELQAEMQRHSLFYEQEVEVAPLQSSKKTRDKNSGRKPIETSTLQEDTTMHEQKTETQHIHVRETNSSGVAEQAADHVRKLESELSAIHRGLIEAHSMKREGIKLAAYATATAALTVGGISLVNWLMKPSAMAPKVVVK
jgi:hypothetical protein